MVLIPLVKFLDHFRSPEYCHRSLMAKKQGEILTGKVTFAFCRAGNE
jgi:hypothetical protein